jgi:glycosyltransferase involved in cell wall biosynthesis
VVEALRYFRDQAALIVAGRTVSGSESFVRAAGYVEDMASAYRAADFTMLGSYYEPFGLVGPESILCGTRLVFEENIGCLPAIQPEFVSTFNVWDNASIRHAISRALELARARKHGIADPLRALRYDPSPLAHARAILSLAG